MKNISEIRTNDAMRTRMTDILHATMAITRTYIPKENLHHAVDMVMAEFNETSSTTRRMLTAYAQYVVDHAFITEKVA